MGRLKELRVYMEEKLEAMDSPIMFTRTGVVPCAKRDIIMGNHA